MLTRPQAIRLRSSVQPADVAISSNNADVIKSLITRAEARIGGVAVARALSYIAASAKGLTVAELTDVLSLDDDAIDAGQCVCVCVLVVAQYTVSDFHENFIKSCKHLPLYHPTSSVIM